MRHQAAHIDLAGDGGGDEGGAALSEQVDASLCLTGQDIEGIGGLAHVSHDGALFLCSSRLDHLLAEQRGGGFCLDWA